MAITTERMVAVLEARFNQYEKALAKAQGNTNRSFTAIERRGKQLESRLSRIGAGINFRGLFAPLAAGVSLRGAQQLLDASTRIENALKVTGLAGEELAKVYGELFDAAQRNYAPLESLVTLYSRAAIVQDELGVSTQELLGFTNNVALALRVAGTDAQSASGALLQLSQALGSGVVRAEEFNSILEGALPIARAAAAGLKEAGGSVAALRQLVIDGEVSSEAFFRAFEAGAPMLESMVSSAEVSVSQAMENIRTALIDAAGRFDEGSAASRRLADALQDLQAYIEGLDFEPATNTLLDFVDQVRWGINQLGLLRDGLYDAAKAFSEWTGGAAVGRLLEYESNGFFTTGGNSAERERAQRRIDNAFATRVAGGKQGRLQAGAAPTELAPISVADYPVGGAGGSSGGRSGSGRTREDAFQRETRQIQERTAAIQAETLAMAGLNPLIDDYGFALEKARAVQDLLTAAEREGLAITPELRASIDSLAEGYANATVEAEKLAEAQDKARQTAEDMRDLGKEVLGGFISDLRNGTSAAEALSNALGRIADRLLDMALNSLFSPGGGGGIGGLVGSIFGGARSFDGGGFTGMGARSGGLDGKGGFPALLHPRETVIDHTKPGSAGGSISIGGNTYQINGANDPQAVVRAIEQYDKGRLARLARDLPQLNRRGAM